jgi:hypothetical protein
MTFNVTFDLGQIKALEKDLALIKDKMPSVFQASVREIGLFIEAQAKMILTRKGGVDTGRLRASIGHGDGGIYEEQFSPGSYVVVVGTNVEYAPYMEFGFTMNTPHVAFIKGVGFRYIHPFSFAGYHYMEEASVVAQRMASVVVDRHIDRVLAEAGF